MQIKYQDNIISKVKKLTESRAFPEAVLLVGDKGAGKHSIANYIAEKLDIECIDMSENVRQEIIYNIYLEPTPRVYILDFNNVSIKAQNALLKLLEEPPKTCTLVCLCENLEQVIPTIRNRCQVWVLRKYTQEELKDFTEDSYLLSVCTTPGQILHFQSLDNVDREEYKKLANTMLDKIHTANVANILTISNRLSFKEDDEKEGKLSIAVFMSMLKHELMERVKCGQNFYTQYQIIDQFCNDLLIPHVNKKHIFENFLLRLKYSV